MTVAPDPTGPSQESVWRYPRPAIAEPSTRHVRIEHRGRVIADSGACVRTLETSHPPSWYLPPTDILTSALRRSARRSFCEWKGGAIYYDLVADKRRAARHRLELSGTGAGVRHPARPHRLLWRARSTAASWMASA